MYNNGPREKSKTGSRRFSQKRNSFHNNLSVKSAGKYQESHAQVCKINCLGICLAGQFTEMWEKPVLDLKKVCNPQSCCRIRNYLETRMTQIKCKLLSVEHPLQDKTPPFLASRGKPQRLVAGGHVQSGSMQPPIKESYLFPALDSFISPWVVPVLVVSLPNLQHWLFEQALLAFH